MRGGRGGANRIGFGAVREPTLGVDRLSHRVHHPAEPGVAGIDHGVRVLDLGAAADTDALELSKRHGERAAIAKPDNLATNPLTATALQMNAISDRQSTLDAANLDHHSLHRGHAAIESKLRNLLDISGEIANDADHETISRRFPRPSPAKQRAPTTFERLKTSFPSLPLSEAPNLVSIFQQPPELQANVTRPWAALRICSSIAF